MKPAARPLLPSAFSTIWHAGSVALAVSIMLRPETEKLWLRLRAEPLLAGFVLVGGTALTLHLGHRLSEDLDFVFVRGERLPRRALDALWLKLEGDGRKIVRNDDPAAADEFEIAGGDLHDFQQDFVADDAVKFSFFCPEPEVLRVLDKTSAEHGPRLATLDELFALKSLVTASRSRLRDWLDLWTLIERRGYTMRQFHMTFDRAGVPTSRETALRRLASGTTPIHDPGYEALAAAGQRLPSPMELRKYFAAAIRRLEEDMAREAWRPPGQRIPPLRREPPSP